MRTALGQRRRPGHESQILLTQQRVKRESEELFKELVQDASDAILIIDDDDVVARFAVVRAIYGDVPIVAASSTRPDAPWTRNGAASARAQAPRSAGRAVSASSGGSLATTGRSCAYGSGAATCVLGRSVEGGVPYPPATSRRRRGRTNASLCSSMMRSNELLVGAPVPTGRASTGTGAGDRHGCRDPVHRPGRLQGRQRHARARDRRRAACRVRAPPGHDCQGIRCRRTDQRRRVRPAHRQPPKPRRGRRIRRASHGGVQRAVHPLRRAGDHDRDCRRRYLRRQRQRRGDDAARGPSPYAAKAACKHGWQRYSPALEQRHGPAA